MEVIHWYKAYMEVCHRRTRLRRHKRETGNREPERGGKTAMRSDNQGRYPPRVPRYLLDSRRSRVPFVFSGRDPREAFDPGGLTVARARHELRVSKTYQCPL